MKLGILLSNDQELDYECLLYGFAITWWRRMGAPKWQVGIRFTICWANRKYGIRFSTYSPPRLSGNYLPYPSKHVAKPTFQ